MTLLWLVRPMAAIALLPLVGLGAPLVALASAVVLGVWLLALGPLPAGATVGSELAIGAGLGLVAVGPTWAARLVGLVGDRASDVEPVDGRSDGALERLYTYLGLAVFGICGGPAVLATTLALSYRVAPTVDALFVGATAGRSLLLGLGLAAPLLAASLLATAARLAIARFGAHTLLVRHRVVSLVAVLAMCLAAMTTQTDALVRAMSAR